VVEPLGGGTHRSVVSHGVFPQFYFRSWTTGVVLQWDYDVPVVYEIQCGFGDLQKDVGGI
jgi:hypothetical protein